MDLHPNLIPLRDLCSLVSKTFASNLSDRIADEGKIKDDIFRILASEKSKEKKIIIVVENDDFTVVQKGAHWYLHDSGFIHEATNIVERVSNLIRQTSQKRENFFHFNQAIFCSLLKANHWSEREIEDDFMKKIFSLVDIVVFQYGYQAKAKNRARFSYLKSKGANVVVLDRLDILRAKKFIDGDINKDSAAKFAKSDLFLKLASSSVAA